MSTYFNERIELKNSLYLSKCDLIQKYNLKTPFKTPQVSKIVFELPLSTFSKSSNKVENFNAVIKGLITFFLLFGGLPKIVYHQSKSSKLKKIYSFKYTLKNKKNIHYFLHSLFLSSLNKSLLENFDLFKKSDNSATSFLLSNSKIVLSMKLKLNSFSEIVDFFNEKG
jgi:hypothetical protein